MTIKKHLDWYIATIGGLSACSYDRLEAMRLALQLFKKAHGGSLFAKPI